MDYNEIIAKGTTGIACLIGLVAVSFGIYTDSSRNQEGSYRTPTSQVETLRIGDVVNSSVRNPWL